MSELTVEWCEEEAARHARQAYYEARALRGAPASGCEHSRHAEAYTLAARALKAKEWARETMLAAEKEAHADGVSAASRRVYNMRASVCETILAILEGREP